DAGRDETHQGNRKRRARASRAKGDSNHVGFLRLLSRVWDVITSLTRPPNAATLFRRADLYRQEGRFEEAADLVAQGLRLSPNNGVGHLLSAYLHVAFPQLRP